MIMIRLLSLLLLPLLAGCWIDTQRHPGVMPGPAELPPGTADLFAPGPEEVLVTRLADPAFVRRAGEGSSFPLYYYRKQARLRAGGWVSAGAGGRVEVLYPQGTVVTLIGEGMGAVGSVSHGEPLFNFFDVDRALLKLAEGEQVRLMGGALLSANGGPIALERQDDEVLRVINRSLSTTWIAYRDEVFQVDPAEAVDLPILEGGTGPLEESPDFRSLRLGEGGPRIAVRGDVDLLPEGSGMRVRSRGPHEVVALGVRLRLDPGDEVLLYPLDSTDPRESADSMDATDPGESEPR